MKAMVRKPAVSGSFYPSDREELASMVDAFFDAIPDPTLEDGELVGFVTPHAGLIYSGLVAARSWREIQGREIGTAVLVGPDHYVGFEGIAVYDQGAFETPLGTVAIDEDLAAALIAAHPKIRAFPEAHRREHCLEVQLPILQRLAPGTKIVPILMGFRSGENVLALSTALARILPGRHAVMAASSDLSHYHDRARAAILDRAGIDDIAGLDAESYGKRISRGETEACGAEAILAVMRAAETLGVAAGEELLYRDSGDAFGETDRVVGYASVLFRKGAGVAHDAQAAAPGMLTAEERATLISLARTSIESLLSGGGLPVLESPPDALARRAGAFVTLTKRGRLRGCIGYTEPVYPLWKTVVEAAASAAAEDPRFDPLDRDEMREIEIEVSVLGPFEVSEPAKIEVGTHGLLIERGPMRGLLLPQVATENRWDRETFLRHACRKAGLPEQAWRDGRTVVKTFRAEVFGEGH